MEALQKKAIECLMFQRDYLRFEANNKNTTEEDIEFAYAKACGYAYAYAEIGLLSEVEVYEYIQRFADACEGR